ncbi:MAG: 4-alpha-glucanotransferase [Methanospirillum sp.]|nr:4-alpha-glucanotransferase [Methanospirillum sp.]
MKTRGSGILLHITSLPGIYGIGDLGPEAYKFVEFLKASGQRYWQILPIHPTDTRYDNSPYHALSAFAGNPLLISPEQLVNDGYLDSSDLEPGYRQSDDLVDFPSVITFKEKLFDLAYNRFSYFGSDSDFLNFCAEQAWWLDDYATFFAIRKQFSPASWSDWPDELKNRNPRTLADYKEKNFSEIEREKFLQYIFYNQWDALRKKCHDAGIRLIGDIPIYIDFDSSDVWINPELFQLNEEKKPLFVAGVPPDYFSSTGQVWNNPLYNWDTMKNSGFSWWISRMKKELSLVDYVRIDHFRGFAGFWEISAGSDTAINGRWVDAPVWDFIRTMVKEFPCLPIIAEDLGIITPDVREIMREFTIPGMKVLVFAFSSPTGDNPYIIHNIPKNSVVYTGTHDNTPVRGWFEQDATYEEKQRLISYLGREPEKNEITEIFIRLAMMSSANTAIMPVQDILGLDAAARMNKPGTEDGNWRWRLKGEMISKELSAHLSELVKIYGR